MAPAPHPRRKPPLGLKNLGNSCYLNSVLQCLAHTPPLARFCLAALHSSACKHRSLRPRTHPITKFNQRLTAGKSPNTCPFCILERQIARCLTLDAVSDSPFKLQKSLTLFAEHFRVGRQEDAHEFLRYAVDACHNVSLKLHGKLGSATTTTTIMSEVFGGALLSQVKCMSCKGESNKTDEIMDVSLDIFQCTTVKGALAKFFQPEVLDGNNKYGCGKCKKLSVAKKQIFMLRAPNVLVIQLKRFEGTGKINRNIDFEETLVLSKFMYKASQESQTEYNLFGSIVHSGFSPESGHYYAYIKDAFGKWYCCNDAFVSLSSTQEVLSEKVYILFYIRTNQGAKSSMIDSSCNALKPSNSNCPSKTGLLNNQIKLSDSNGRSASPCEKSSEFMKPPPVKQNGAFSSKVNGTAIIKNGKMSTSLQIRPINMRNLELKRVIENGKGNLDVHNVASVEKSSGNLEQLKNHKESPEYSLMDESKIADGIQAYPAANGNAINKNATSHSEDHCKKQKLLASNGVVSENQLNAKVHEGEGNQLATSEKIESDRELSSSHMVNNGIGPHNLLIVEGDMDGDKHDVETVNNEPDGGHSSNNMINSTSASKRKLCDAERVEVQALCCKESNSMPKDSLCTKSTKQRTHSPEELEKFKEQLSREAHSHLHSCDWANRLHDFMRTRKRICVQQSGGCLDNDELRKQLISDAKMRFTSQIPESLKTQLIGQLRTFYDR